MIRTPKFLENHINNLKKAANSAVKHIGADLHEVTYVQFEQPLEFCQSVLDEAEDRYVRDNYNNHISILGRKASPIYNWKGHIHAGIKERSLGDQYVLKRHHAPLEPFISRDLEVIDDIATVESSSVILSSATDTPEDKAAWHVIRHTPLGPELCEKTSYDSNTRTAYVHVGRLGDTVPFTSSADIRKIPLTEVPPEIAGPRLETLCRALVAATAILDNVMLDTDEVICKIRKEPHRGAKGHVL